MVIYNICKGRAIRIAVGITMLTLLLVGGAGASTPISACTAISSSGSYVLTQNIDSIVSSCITITAKDVIFDGAGFTITGGGIGNGVYVISNSGLLTNVTVKNLKVTNWNYGIYYRDVKNNGNIVNNTVNNSAIGIYLQNSQGNNISSNVIGNSSTTGIYFLDINSWYNTIKNNIVNGDIYYHFVNENDTLIEGLNLNAPKVSSLGKISVISSKNVTLRNLILTNNSGVYGSGLFLYDSNASMNNINSSFNGYGIRLYYSSNNTINSSNTSLNTQYGVSLEYSNNNSLDSNIAVSNQRGIYLFYANNNNLTNNNAHSNVNGIYLYFSSGNTLNGNNASNGITIGNSGISLSSSSNNTLKGNNDSNNGYGITLSSSSNNNTLISNIFLNNNNNYGISVSNSGGNSIYNNFFNNTRNFGIDSSVNRWNITKTSGTNIAGGPNLGGNFWDNPVGSGFSRRCEDNDLDGICDTSFNLTSDNIDFLPLTKAPIQVTNPSANPSIILNDNGRSRPTGTNITSLNVTVTGNVSSVTIDLSPIGGSTAALMTRISGTDNYTIITNATSGINLTNNLVLNATDTSGNFHNSVSISLTVLLRGDIVRDNKIDLKDLLYMRRYLAGLEPSINKFVADIQPAEGDGKVDLKDLLFLRRYLAGLEPVI